MLFSSANGGETRSAHTRKGGRTRRERTGVSTNDSLLVPALVDENAELLAHRRRPDSSLKLVHLVDETNWVVVQAGGEDPASWLRGEQVGEEKGERENALLQQTLISERPSEEEVLKSPRHEARAFEAESLLDEEVGEGGVKSFELGEGRSGRLSGDKNVEEDLGEAAERRRQCLKRDEEKGRKEQTYLNLIDSSTF